MELHASLAATFTEWPSRFVRYAIVNGLPGFVTIEQDGVLQTTAPRIEDDKVAGIYVVRDPDKFAHLRDVAVH
jgi:RNA polymerase sigma-70 factor, ECF subfamily